MAHDHHHVHVTAPRVLAAAAVTLVAAAVELWVSHTSGALFLSADAVHLVAHLGIFIVLLLPTRGAHERREDVVTIAVLLVVLAVAVAVAFEARAELASSAAPPNPAAMLVSLLGLVANLTAAWLFRDPAHTHWSFRAALAHELSDAALTVVGLFGAGAIALFHFVWVDPLLSFAVAGWLGVWSLRLLARRVRMGREAWEIEAHDGHEH